MTLGPEWQPFLNQHHGYWREAMGMPWDGVKCEDCDRVFDSRIDRTFGPEMWIDEFFTCKHERPLFCNVCKWKRQDDRNFRTCSVCGCGEVYT